MASEPHSGLTPQDPAYRRALIAALCAGLASFNALYATQAVLPALGDYFHTSPTTTALTVSATTGALALAIVPLGALSERFSRRKVLCISALAATLVSFLLPFSPSIHGLILLRFLQGIAVAGVPAIIMAYLAEEIHRQYLPKVMGLYISGTTLGGLVGRLIPGIAVDFTSWQWSLAASALFAFSMAVLMALLLPRQRYFTAKPLSFSGELTAMLSHWTNPMMVRLFLIPFLTMGSFVSLYNYLGFRLMGSFGLPASLAAATFVLYLSGTWSSARTGAFMMRFGRGRVLVGSVALMLLGALIMLAPNLASTLTGALLFTAMFFVAHSACSTWVAAAAQEHRSEASSSYVLMYYLGSSLMGWVSGWFFERGWAVLIAWLCTLLLSATALAAVQARAVRSAHTA
ncbi:MFS transporter [Corynebacterium sp. zg254]|uniref:MFS transporter n=1 Tax=Corynebacterium zhongnanshanii TaxID=2768834 RepID=A0ABQ6VCU3_9CORY|nr:MULTISPECIES: MFS transporter [Corynebacterium]KAB3519994.1 MFS transporter [Corynebacterium zhongnanshanii]MCR5914944.1 MFS transporter [Corynebacterium sp. zg254]